MRKSNTQKIGEVISDYLREFRLEKKVTEARIINSWPSIVGPTIARQTEKLYIRNGVFYVHITSPVLRNELSYMKTRIMEVLNEQAGEMIITKVVLR
jgi:predicted nucleic acid-binding Zn ribbon protein